MKHFQKLVIGCTTLALASCVATKSKDDLRAEIKGLESKVDSLEGTRVSNMDSIQVKRSYALGVQIASGFKEQGLDTLLLSQHVANGFVDAMADTAALNEQQMQTVLRAFQMELMQQQQGVEGQANLEEGQAFLEQNAQRAEVTELPSGLQYEVLEQGTGPVPDAKDTVKTHYKGMLLNGEVFDSSYDRGKPFTTQAGGRIIEGWQQALQMMPEGSKWRIYLPPNLAYGERGNQGIPPNATLIFELELLEVMK